MRQIVKGVRNWVSELPLYVALAVVTTLLLQVIFGIAVAQEAAPSEIDTSDFRQWFSNPAVGVAGIVGVVHWLRKRYPFIDGPIVVPAVALLVGALSGMAGQFTGMLTVLPFSEWQFPLGGLTYGISLAVTGVIGVNLFELVTSKLGKALIGLFTRGGDDAPAAASDTRTDAAQFLGRR